MECTFLEWKIRKNAKMSWKRESYHSKLRKTETDNHTTSFSVIPLCPQYAQGCQTLIRGSCKSLHVSCNFTHTHKLTMPEVPLTLINEDLTLGKDLRQLLLELPVLLGIGQRLHRSGAERTRRGNRKWGPRQQKWMTEGNKEGEAARKVQRGTESKMISG